MNRPTNRLMTVTATGAAVGAMTLGMVAGTGQAGADNYVEQNTARNCMGFSPNVVDNPYYGGVRVAQDKSEPGRVTVLWGNPSFWPSGYRTDGVVAWKNLTTGKHGEQKAQFDHPIDGGGFSTVLHTGAGKVRLTTRAANRGAFLTLPAPTCTGVVTVR